MSNVLPIVFNNKILYGLQQGLYEPWLRSTDLNCFGQHQQERHEWEGDVYGWYSGDEGLDKVVSARKINVCFFFP